MKKRYVIGLIFISLGFGIQANALNLCQLNTQSVSQKQMLLATTCTADNCTSCWDQCTKSDDCGVDHNCVSTPCGNRCVKATAD